MHVNNHECYYASKVSNSYSCTASSAEPNSLSVKEE